MARWCVTAAAVPGFAPVSGSPSLAERWQRWLLAARAVAGQVPAPPEPTGALAPLPKGSGAHTLSTGTAQRPLYF